LLLGQIMMHMHAVVALVTEALRELQELFRDSPWDIREDQVSDHIVGSPEPRCKLTEQPLSYLGTVRQPRNQLIVLQGPQLTGRNRGSGGRPRSRIEDGEFAKHLARPEHRQQVLPPRRSSASQLDLAAYYDVEPVLRVTLVEEHVPLVEIQLPHGRGERG